MMENSSSDYQKALDYIYSFVDFSRTHQENLSPENFDLTRMVEFMNILGSPQDDFPSIHIAGSKGKGSVSAFCSSVLEKAGYKVGLYTSPHLKDFEERIQINHKPIPRNLLVDLIEEIKPAVKQVYGLTTFEIMTGLGFLYFSKMEVDIAVVEVGLGGRLDATNIISPLVSVITSLYLDHISILGDSIDKIAAEKGGIIKETIPVICAPQVSEALEVLETIAADKGANLIRVDFDYPYSILSKSLEGQTFRIESPDKEIEDEFWIPLLGDYQVINAVTAYGVLDTLNNKGYLITKEHIKEGFASMIWPGRFEVLRKDPPVIVDSAHNPASIRKLRETVDEFFPEMPLILIFGISEDKQLAGMLEGIMPRVSYLITTKADHPRAMDPTDLLDQATTYNCPKEAIDLPSAALIRAIELAGQDRLVLITGSIFVAASARIAWFELNLDRKSGNS